MLILLGPLQFKVAPFNTTEYSHSHSASFAEKPIIGARPPLEWTGDGTETWSIRANLFPKKFGGESALTILALMRKMGAPQYMMRGDGTLMGWVVVTDVSERSSYLAADGVGKVVEVDISLTRSSMPTPAGYFEAAKNLFGGLF